MNRYLANLLTTQRAMRRAFPAPVLADIEAAIGRAERRHTGQICFVIETALELPELLAGVRPRERALEVFSQLGVWDTRNNNGVLVYLLLAERDVEIVADRGLAAHVADAQWCEVCDDIEAAFRRGAFGEGSVQAVDAVAALIERHFPPDDDGANPNELPDRPLLL